MLSAMFRFSRQTPIPPSKGRQRKQVRTLSWGSPASPIRCSGHGSRHFPAKPQYPLARVGLTNKGRASRLVECLHFRCSGDDTLSRQTPVPPVSAVSGTGRYSKVDIPRVPYTQRVYRLQPKQISDTAQISVRDRFISIQSTTVCTFVLNK